MRWPSRRASALQGSAATGTLGVRKVKPAADLVLGQSAKPRPVPERMVQHSLERSPTAAHADQRDEGPKHVVGALADLVDARVAHHGARRLIAE